MSARLLLAGLVALPLAVAASPYAGLERRDIKALSSAQVEDLTQGRGAGLALAAELNGYPGPAHVLELASPLGLNAGQLAATRTLWDRMAVEARSLGVRIVAEEAALDNALATRTLDPDGLDARLRRIGELQGELRSAHMRTHLEQAAMLSSDQMAAYNRLRGYDGTPPGRQDDAPSHHR